MAEEKKVEEKPKEEKAEVVEEEKTNEVVEEVVEKEVIELPETEEKITVEEKEPFAEWTPKTSLGKKVFEGKITDIEEIFKSGEKIYEPEIVDRLVPNLKNELISIGGRTGKGGGKQRIPIKITAKMHRSGRRFRASAFAVVGNEDGIVGIGKASTVEPRDAIMKAVRKGKLNIIKVKRGCGSWECGCGEEHSIPYKIEGKCGSVRVKLLPAPKGVGLVAHDAAKIVFRYAGIKDVWVKTEGNTSMRINLVTAIFNALKNLYVYDKTSD